MTLMLASVAGPAEAEDVLARGADIIDLQDAANAFGAVPLAVVRATVAKVGGRRPVSAAAGTLPMEPKAVMSAATALADAGVDYVRVGLFAGPKRFNCIRALSALSRRVKLVGVMFIDEGLNDALIPFMAENGFAGVMLDSAHKKKSRLLDRMDIPALATVVDAVRAHGMLAALAGAIEPPDVPRLLLLAPDIIGFRAAQTDAATFDAVRALIPADPRGGAPEQNRPAKVDYRLLTRGAADARKEEATDRIFVHDFVLPVHIGTYARERDKPQDVRFNVDVRVLRSGQAAEDMRDVFSYDLITDSIRMIAAREHIGLVETFAEQIAAAVLRHPRVAGVTVRVEKLEVGSGSVGVEIVRERPAEAATVRHIYSLGGESDPKATS
jgi:(5-formylfuran-3-yl)methyl phosphate synthase